MADLPFRRSAVPPFFMASRGRLNSISHMAFVLSRR